MVAAGVTVDGPRESGGSTACDVVSVELAVVSCAEVDDFRFVDELPV